MNGSLPSFAFEIALTRNRGPASAGQRAQTQASSVEVEGVGPSLLGFPAARLVPLGGGVSGGEAGDRRPLASCRISPLLALAFSAEGVGEAEDGF